MSSVYIRPRMLDDGSGAIGRGRTSPSGAQRTLPRTVSHDVIRTNTHALGTFFDTLIRKWRGGFYKQEAYIPSGQALVNWTTAGPRRPELHLKARNLRHEEQANTIEGLHTNPPVAVVNTTRVALARPGTVPGRQNRLTTSRYRGQSYSATTKRQG